MYYLTVETSLDAAHFLSGYQGKCQNIHGHQWKIIVTIKSSNLIKEGPCTDMVVDFKELKAIVKKEVDYFDHSLIIKKGSLDQRALESLSNFLIRELDFQPTAERLAYYFYHQIKSHGLDVDQVAIYETPANQAIYKEA